MQKIKKKKIRIKTKTTVNYVIQRKNQNKEALLTKRIDIRPKISNKIKQTNPETNYYDPTTAPSPIPNYHVLNPSEKQLNKWETQHDIEIEKEK